MNIIGKIKKFDVSIVFLILVYFTTLLIKSLYSTTGYLGPDATWYLKAAKNLYELNFLFFNNLEIYGNKIPEFYNYGSFFAVWPPLYPILISITSFIFNIDFYLASKLTNFFCFLIILYILKKYVKFNILIYFIFFNATFIEIYCHSLSEYLFITILLLLLHNINTLNLNAGKYTLFSIFVLLNLLFLTRYNGLFAHFAILFFVFYSYIYKNYFYKNLLLITLSSMIFCFIYLIFINILTGYPTGYPREIDFNINYKIFYIIKTILLEFNYIISNLQDSLNFNEDIWINKFLFYLFTITLQFVPLVFINFNNLIIFKNFKLLNIFNLLIIIFLIFYLCSIFILTTFINVDPLHFRSIGPASFLFILLIISNFNFIDIKIKFFILYLISISFIINVVFPTFYFENNLIKF